jgi:hypothetical protein
VRARRAATTVAALLASPACGGAGDVTVMRPPGWVGWACCQHSRVSSSSLLVGVSQSGSDRVSCAGRAPSERMVSTREPGWRL